jgi:putative MATE family efflux protein
VLGDADTVLLGWYSTTALATISLVLPMYVFATALIVPWGTATQILVARWIGAGDRERINRILDTGLGFSLLVGTGAAVVVLGIAPALVNAVAGGAPLPDSVTALRILVLCLPFAAVTAHYRGVFGGLGHTGIAMRVALLVNVTNIPMSYLLVFGLDLGAIGSAYGTALATALGAVYIIWFGRRRLGAEYTFWRRRNLTRPREILAPLTRIGWPDATFAATAYGADIVLVAIVAYLGQESLAGYRLMVTTITVLWVVVFSASSGISILAGQRLGAEDLPGVGTTAVAIGSPFGLDGSVSAGIVSALDRTLSDGATTLTGLIQTDAAINPGNSGGPLVDDQGRIIGINTAIYSGSGTNEGVGFAVPATTAPAGASQHIHGGVF